MAKPQAFPTPPESSTRASQAEVRKGDWVRLLEPHYDGFQRLETGAVVRWWNDAPPDPCNAVPADSSEPMPLDAPPMTDGKPPADYLDPLTGRKPVAGTV
jgi:hypothetical protein